MISEDRLRHAVSVIRERVKITDILRQEHVMHIPHGRGMVSCLFHSESRPSMSIDDEKGVFYCFSCNRHGSVITLIRECEQELHAHTRSFPDTIDYIIRTNPEVQRELGFSTVVLEDTAEHKLPRDASGNVCWEFKRPKHPTLLEATTPIALARKLRSRFRSRNDEATQNQIMCFISYCEQGLPIELLKDACNGKQIQQKQITQISEDVLEDLALFMKE